MQKLVPHFFNPWKNTLKRDGVSGRLEIQTMEDILL